MDQPAGEAYRSPLTAFWGNVQQAYFDLSDLQSSMLVLFLVLSAIFFILLILYSSSGDLRFRSLRLYSTTLVTGFGYVALTYLTDFEQVAVDIVGSSVAEDDQRAAKLKILRIALSATFYLSALSYFFSTILDLGYRVVPFSAVAGKSSSGQTSFFLFPAFVIANIFLMFKYGIIPIALAIMVVPSSVEITVPQLHVLISQFVQTASELSEGEVYNEVKKSFEVISKELEASSGK